MHGQLCPLRIVFSGTQSIYVGQDKLQRLTPVLWGIRVSAKAGDFSKSKRINRKKEKNFLSLRTFFFKAQKGQTEELTVLGHVMKAESQHQVVHLGGQL